MSYIQSRIRCDHCQRELNVAFGIVGTTQIAGWPTECPTCRHDQGLMTLCSDDIGSDERIVKRGSQNTTTRV